MYGLAVLTLSRAISSRSLQSVGDTSQEIAFMLIHGTGENNSDISAFKPILTKKTKYILKICKAKRNEYLQWCYNHH